MVERLLVVGEEHAVYRLQVQVEAHSLLQNEAPQSSQQGIEWQGSARVHGERHGRVAARRAEAAHLFPAVNSTTSMMLSAESGAAGVDNAGALPRT